MRRFGSCYLKEKQQGILLFGVTANYGIGRYFARAVRLTQVR